MLEHYGNALAVSQINLNNCGENGVILKLEAFYVCMLCPYVFQYNDETQGANEDEEGEMYCSYD